MTAGTLFRAGIRTLASPAVTIGLLAALITLIVHGTICQAEYGVFEAERRVFEAWLVFAGGWLPLPGVQTILALLAVNLTLAAARLSPAWKNAGLFVLYPAITLLLAVSCAAGFLRREASLTLAPGETSAVAITAEGRRVDLPAAITLIDFTERRAPVTGAVVDYESRVHVRGQGVDRDAVIAMNRPLRLGDYTFYQADFRHDGGETSSGITVVCDPLRQAQPVAGLLIAAGLLLHFAIAAIGRMRRDHA